MQHRQYPGFFPPINCHPPEPRLVQEEILWSDKRRPFFGLPLSFTRYTLYTDRLTIRSGFLTKRTEDIRLYRILDVSLKQSLGQRLFKLGSIRLQSADAGTPNQFMHDIRYPEEVYRLVSDTAEQQRKLNRVGIMEYFDHY